MNYGMNLLRNIWPLVLLSGCAGVGVVSQSDPLIKLNDAEVLFMRKDRPLIAERLIHEAIAIYVERDDAHGLGNSYREYGDLLKSSAVTRDEGVYRRSGFLDKSITFEYRLAKANEFYMKALEYYRMAEVQDAASNKYDALTNVYYNMAWSNLALGNKDEACADYDRTLQAYKENMRHNPTAHPAGPTSIPGAIESLKQRESCT